MQGGTVQVFVRAKICPDPCKRGLRIKSCLLSWYRPKSSQWPIIPELFPYYCQLKYLIPQLSLMKGSITSQNWPIRLLNYQSKFSGHCAECSCEIILKGALVHSWFTVPDSKEINFHVKYSSCQPSLPFCLENVKRERTPSWLSIRTVIWIRVTTILARFINITDSGGLARGILHYPLLAYNNSAKLVWYIS